jgi:hypothetical protein
MSKPDEYRANAQECERMAASPVILLSPSLAPLETPFFG